MSNEPNLPACVLRTDARIATVKADAAAFPAGRVVDWTGLAIYNDSSALEDRCGAAAISRGAEQRLLQTLGLRKGHAHAGHIRRRAARRPGGDHAASFQAKQGIGQASGQGCAGKLVESSRTGRAEERRQASPCVAACAGQRTQKRSRPGRRRSAAGRSIDRAALCRAAKHSRGWTMGSRSHRANPSGVEPARGVSKKGGAS